jgi:hypothetical protein
MVVQTQEQQTGQSGAVGLHIGIANAKQYFPRELESIELELDHLRIVCPLEASFWQDRPEIHDHRLSSWLESKRNSGKLGPRAAAVVMIPCGKCAFRLQMVSKEETDRMFAPPALPDYFSPTVSPVVILDRRKRSLGNDMGRKPERRKVVKLRSDDRASASANN